MAKKTKNKKVESALHKFGAESIERLAQIADDEETPQKLRADIWKWFAEMEFGKPTSKSSGEKDLAEEGTEVTLEGELELWSR